MEKTYQVYRLSGDVIGQYVESDFTAKIRTGEILPTDFYLTEGMDSLKLVDDYIREKCLFT